MKYDFKPFQKVLVRDAACTDGWRAHLFSHFRGSKPVVLGGWEYSEVIPYEGNERLLGTNDSPEDQFKKGDIVAVWDKNDTNKMIRIYSHYDSKEGKHVTYMMSDTFVKWDYAEKFAPATVEDPAVHRGLD